MFRAVGQALQDIAPRHLLFKWGFNASPMYRRSSGRVVDVSKDLHSVKIEIPLSWKNRNYVGTMFGGSMLAATDPIFMIQLIGILGDDFVVWDKSVNMRFRRPARTALHASFTFSQDDLDMIRVACREDGEMELVKEVVLTDDTGEVVAQGSKVLYVANKAYRQAKQASRAQP